MNTLNGVGHRATRLFGLLLGWAVALGAAIAANAASPPVEVRNVTFNFAQGASSTGPYFETIIELNGRENPKKGAEDSNYNNRIGVKLLLGFEGKRRVLLPDGRRGRRPIYFSSDVMFATLKRNDTVLVHFFIPPAVVEREQLANRPDAYLIEITVEQEELPPTGNHASENIRSKEALEVFRKAAYAGAAENDGIMVPIYRTPFWALNADQGRLGRSPSYVLK